MEARRVPADGWMEWCKDRVITQGLLLPFLILTTSFLVFLDHNVHCVACPETWISLAGIAAAAVVASLVMLAGGHAAAVFVTALLIMFFIEMQFGWTKYPLVGLALGFVALSLMWRETLYLLLTTVSASFLIATIVQMTLSEDASRTRFPATPVAAGDTPPPRIFHFILDEHIGIEGIPTETQAGREAKERLKRFYERHGFRLYGGAYSHYYYSDNSISNMLNFSTEDVDKVLLHGEEPYKLLSNRYFGVLSERKYRVSVLQPQYIDFCADVETEIENCLEYRSNGLSAVASLEMPTSQKLQVTWSRYLRQSHRYRRFVDSYAMRRAVFARWGFSLPEWTWKLDEDRMRMHSLTTLMLLDGLWEDVLSMKSGNVLFAHLLIPHRPYVLRADCSVRLPIRTWRNRRGFRGRTIKDPGPDVLSREDHYQLYFEQLDCLYDRLDELFERMKAEGIYADSIILLNGDHGSRIVMNEPFLRNRDIVTERDLVDGFSTLFAVKLPGVRGGYDSSTRPLEELFEEAFLGAATELEPSGSEPFVFLSAGPRKPLVPVPYPRARAPVPKR